LSAQIFNNVFLELREHELAVSWDLKVLFLYLAFVHDLYTSGLAKQELIDVVKFKLVDSVRTHLHDLLSQTTNKWTSFLSFAIYLKLSSIKVLINLYFVPWIICKVLLINQKPDLFLIRIIYNFDFPLFTTASAAQKHSDKVLEFGQLIFFWFYATILLEQIWL